ncbi:Pestheic acid cluster transcriptional regulator [Dirofilaria immitis]
MGRQGVIQVIKQEIMEEINGSRCLQRDSNKIFLKKEEMDAISSSAVTTTAINSISSSTQVSSFKAQPDESILRRIDPADDLQLMCTKKCIPCHRCGSSMKFFMRRVKYLNTVKEYPAYRCMKKKCQTFRSPRTLARECNMLLRQGFGDGRFMNVTPTTNATRQLKEAFPDHFNKQEIDGSQGYSTTFRDDFDAFSNNPALLANPTTTSNIIREKEAWYALRNAKQSLDILAHTDGGLSLRLQRIIGEIYAMAAQFKEIPKKDGSFNTVIECNNSRQMEIDRMHDMMDDEGDDGWTSMKRSTVNDLISATHTGSDSESRSLFHTETSSVDTCILMKMSSSTSTLSTNITPVQPLRWINISRHSPSFSVKMVDSSNSAIRQTVVDQKKQTINEQQQQSTNIYESFSNCPDDNANSIQKPTTILRSNTALSSLSLPSIVHDQLSTGYNYGTTMNINTNMVTKTNPELGKNNNNEEISKNEPIPIYVRPSELCFDDITDSGEILSEFFMPSTTTSNFQPSKSTTTNGITLSTPGMSTNSNTIPLVTFAQFWNFNEQNDHKKANPTLSPATSATICPL